MKIENWGRKNRNVSTSFDSVYDSVAYDPVKPRLSEPEAEAEEPTNRKAQNRKLSLVYYSASACDSDLSDGVISRISVLLPVFTSSNRSTLLSTTPTTTPSLVKTSLKEDLDLLRFHKV